MSVIQFSITRKSSQIYTSWLSEWQQVSFPFGLSPQGRQLDFESVVFQ